MASHSRNRSKSEVAEKRPVFVAAATRVGPMVLMYDSPLVRASTFFVSTSNPMTRNPASQNTSASGRPT